MESINAGSGFDPAALKYRDIDGSKLIIGIAQDAETNQVLMVAFLNQEAVEKTFETGKMHYYSTSRKKLWLKGESSGHTQQVKEAYVDCDLDAIVFKIEQEGGACHMGYRSCFYRRVEGSELKVEGEKVFDPDKVY